MLHRDGGIRHDGIDRPADRLLLGFLAVFVDLGRVAHLVEEARGAADATAGASHALDEIAGQFADLGLVQRHAALVEAVRRDRLDLKGAAEFLQGLLDRFAHAAGTGEDAPVIRGVI